MKKGSLLAILIFTVLFSYSQSDSSSYYELIVDNVGPNGASTNKIKSNKKLMKISFTDPGYSKIKTYSYFLTSLSKSLLDSIYEINKTCYLNNDSFSAIKNYIDPFNYTISIYKYSFSPKSQTVKEKELIKSTNTYLSSYIANNPGFFNYTSVPIDDDNEGYIYEPIYEILDNKSVFVVDHRKIVQSKFLKGYIVSFPNKQIDSIKIEFTHSQDLLKDKRNLLIALHKSENNIYLAYGSALLSFKKSGEKYVENKSYNFKGVNGFIESKGKDYLVISGYMKDTFALKVVDLQSRKLMYYLEKDPLIQFFNHSGEYNGFKVIDNHLYIFDPIKGQIKNVQINKWRIKKPIELPKSLSDTIRNMCSQVGRVLDSHHNQQRFIRSILNDLTLKGLNSWRINDFFVDGNTIWLRIDGHLFEPTEESDPVFSSTLVKIVSGKIVQSYYDPEYNNQKSLLGLIIVNYIRNMHLS